MGLINRSCLPWPPDCQEDFVFFQTAEEVILGGETQLVNLSAFGFDNQPNLHQQGPLA